MCNVKCFDVPVITGATGIVTEVLKKLEKILAKYLVDTPQKEAVLETSYLISKVLQSQI
jgi:hypothetical protein